MKYNSAIDAIKNELDKALRKFPEFPVDAVHAAAIITEESGELQRASLRFTYDHGSYSEMETEAIQTAAMAIRFLMHIESLEPIKSKQAYTTFYPQEHNHE